MPDKETIANVLKTYDFYLYLGHGAGEKFFGEKDLKNINKINPIVMLIGCSSNRQTLKEQENLNGNKLELNGISLDYLLSNWYLIFL